MGELQGKRVLVTAGGQGIGKAISEAFIRSGCSVCVHYFSSKVEPAELIADAGVEAATVQTFGANLCNASEAAELVGRSVEAMGGLDILINNAGSLIARRDLAEVDAVFYRQTMDLNLGSMVWVTQAALPHLMQAPDGASIVNLASLAGRKGGHGGSLMYSTAKGAVLTYTRALATELGPNGVRVNAVAPGLILGTKFHNTHTTPESARETVRGIPLGRAGTAEDVARAVAYLASEYNGFITGATLDINGGVYCC